MDDFCGTVQGNKWQRRAVKQILFQALDKVLRLLDEDDIRELNIFSYVRKKDGAVVISEVADEDDWKTVRADMIKTIGVNSIPQIYVERIENDDTLILKHEYDGRDLELEHAEKVVKHIKNIWKSDVRLYTVLEDDVWEI